MNENFCKGFEKTAFLNALFMGAEALGAVSNAAKRTNAMRSVGKVKHFPNSVQRAMHNVPRPQNVNTGMGQTMVR